MNLYVKYDSNLACKIIIQEQLEKAGLVFEMHGLGEIELKNNPPQEKIKELQEGLRRYGVEIIDNHNSTLIQRIKDAIIEMVFQEESLPLEKTSSYLAGKLNHSYGYISNLFSEMTYSSIENFIILQKIERAKQMIIMEELTLTEIAYKLNYSSVAHLSNQFKKTTGLTPSSFQRIIKKRRAR
ncbi:MAG: helix-turn-helix domain-containing protein [Syntrophothermus sp.]